VKPIAGLILDEVIRNRVLKKGYFSSGTLPRFLK
jgi:hypothetical protein